MEPSCDPPPWKLWFWVLERVIYLGPKKRPTPHSHMRR